MASVRIIVRRSKYGHGSGGSATYPHVWLVTWNEGTFHTTLSSHPTKAAALRAARAERAEARAKIGHLPGVRVNPPRDPKTGRFRKRWR